MDSDIEKIYREKLNQLSGAERVEKALSAFDSFCDILRFQLLKHDLALSERSIKLRIAQRLYRSDHNITELFKRVRIE